MISYTILVTNTGNMTLTGVSVADPRIVESRRDPAVGGNQTTGFAGDDRDADLHRAYTVTQAEIDNNGGGDGDLDNTVTADSNQTGPDDRLGGDPDHPDAALTIVKTLIAVDADTTPPISVTAAGEVVATRSWSRTRAT